MGPPADHAALYSIQYPNFSLLSELAGVCLNYPDMRSQSENVYSLERSSPSDSCIWYAGASPFNSPFLNEILVSECRAAGAGFDKVKCGGGIVSVNMFTLSSACPLKAPQ